MRELAKLKVLTEGEKQHLHPAYAYVLPARLIPCPVADGLFSFQQRKEKRKRNAARNRWFLDLLCPVADFRKMLNVALPVRLTRSAAYFSANIESLSSFVLFFIIGRSLFLNHSPDEWFSLYKKDHPWVVFWGEIILPDSPSNTKSLGGSPPDQDPYRS